MNSGMPATLPPLTIAEEDWKKLDRRVKAEEKKLAKGAKALPPQRMEESEQPMTKEPFSQLGKTLVHPKALDSVSSVGAPIS